MMRRAFTMRLKPEGLAQYRYHHDNIWTELVDEIERAGIASITTFQRGLDLFLVSEISDQGAWDRLWSSPVHRRWAELMEPLMHLREDGVVDAEEMTEVFHVETRARSNGVHRMQAVVVEQAADESTRYSLDAPLGAWIDHPDSEPANAPAGDLTDAVANRAALADALSELSDALDRETFLRGEAVDAEPAVVDVEMETAVLVAVNPLAELIADTADPLERSIVEPLVDELGAISAVLAESQPSHAARRQKVSPSARQAKPVAKRSGTPKKSRALKKQSANRSPKKTKKKVAAKSAKKSPKTAKVRTAPRKPAAKKTAKKSSGRAKKRR